MTRLKRACVGVDSFKRHCLHLFMFFHYTIDSSLPMKSAVQLPTNGVFMFLFRTIVSVDSHICLNGYQNFSIIFHLKVDFSLLEDGVAELKWNILQNGRRHTTNVISLMDSHFHLESLPFAPFRYLCLDEKSCYGNSATNSFQFIMVRACEVNKLCFKLNSRGNSWFSARFIEYFLSERSLENFSVVKPAFDCCCALFHSFSWITITFR